VAWSRAAPGLLRHCRDAVPDLWIILPLIGSIVWFVKTNGALNRYWESLGAS
jgi:hypothetical protein